MARHLGQMLGVGEAFLGTSKATGYATTGFLGGLNMLTGRCECAKVKYQVEGQIHDFSHCHCSQCRRLHGAAFATFAGVSRADFRYRSGESDLASYASSDSHSRVFCSHCGSNILVALTTEPDDLYLAMGTMDGNPDCPPDYHIFVGSKAPWYRLNDKAPGYETFPEDEA